MHRSGPDIVFMGTPGFAVESLRMLLAEGYPVKAVVTAPDRPAGRGKKIHASAVKEFVNKEYPEIKLLQPEKLRDPVFLEELRILAPDLIVVVAFRMLPEAVWALPPMGCFNLHASLLPDYRGAAPINHVIMNGEKQSGVTSFLIDRNIDTGNILLQRKTLIGEEENAGDLHDRLMNMGAKLVVKTVKGLTEGSLKARPQEDFMKKGIPLKTAPKIRKEDCRINWNRPAAELYNFIRGLSPFPGAYTYLENEKGEKTFWKIYDSDVEPASHPQGPGILITDGKNELKASTTDGYLHIREVQQEGKKKMRSVDFLRGVSLTSGEFRFS